VLFVHDVHAVMGERELEFEDALRDAYAATVADDDTRLLWYFNSTHGAGEAYKIVTITALRDGTAWERLVERLRRGDLSEWSGRAEAMRYGLTSTLLVAAPWSPIADLHLESVPDQPQEHEVRVFREDALEGPGVDAASAERFAEPRADDAVMTCVAAFRPAVETEEKLRILYRVAAPDAWTPAFGLDAGWNDWPGSLTPTLSELAGGSSRTLRTTSWSPLA
jgi:hypothetical protein